MLELNVADLVGEKTSLENSLEVAQQELSEAHAGFNKLLGNARHLRDALSKECTKHSRLKRDMQELLWEHLPLCDPALAPLPDLDPSLPALFSKEEDSGSGCRGEGGQTQQPWLDVQDFGPFELGAFVGHGKFGVVRLCRERSHAGRGLDALIPGASLEVGESEVYNRPYPYVLKMIPKYRMSDLRALRMVTGELAAARIIACTAATGAVHAAEEVFHGCDGVYLRIQRADCDLLTFLTRDAEKRDEASRGEGEAAREAAREAETRDDRLAPTVASALGSQLVAALAYIEKLGIAHRDIKVRREEGGERGRTSETGLRSFPSFRLF